MKTVYIDIILKGENNDFTVRVVEINEMITRNPGTMEQWMREQEVEIKRIEGEELKILAWRLAPMLG